MAFAEALGKYLQCCHDNVAAIAFGTEKLILPIVNNDFVARLCNNVQQVFANEPVVLELNMPLIVVGDIHGHIIDLFRIIARFGLPPKQSYLFLGDIIDRGEFSTECVVIVFLLKLIYPENIYIIRGNHEFEFLCSTCGFSRQLDNQSLLTSFLNVFSVMPIAALIMKSKLAVHGGIGPSLTSIHQITTIPRPLTHFGDDLTDSLLWSDPAKVNNGFEKSSRGTGYLFGEDVLQDFLDNNGLTLLIRGHECINEGVSFRFHHRLVTVFSASNYCGISSNSAGVLRINSDGTYSPETFEPLPYLRRSGAYYVGEGIERLPQRREKTLKRNKRHGHSCGITSVTHIITPKSGISSILSSTPLILTSNIKKPRKPIMNQSTLPANLY